MAKKNCLAWAMDVYLARGGKICICKWYSVGPHYGVDFGHYVTSSLPKDGTYLGIYRNAVEGYEGRAAVRLRVLNSLQWIDGLQYPPLEILHEILHLYRTHTGSEEDFMQKREELISRLL